MEGGARGLKEALAWGDGKELTGSEGSKASPLRSAAAVATGVSRLVRACDWVRVGVLRPGGLAEGNRWGALCTGPAWSARGLDAVQRVACARVAIGAGREALSGGVRGGAPALASGVLRPWAWRCDVWGDMCVEQCHLVLGDNTHRPPAGLPPTCGTELLCLRVGLLRRCEALAQICSGRHLEEIDRKSACGSNGKSNPRVPDEQYCEDLLGGRQGVEPTTPTS